MKLVFIFLPVLKVDSDDRNDEYGFLEKEEIQFISDSKKTLQGLHNPRQV